MPAVDAGFVRESTAVNIADGLIGDGREVVALDVEMKLVEEVVLDYQGWEAEAAHRVKWVRISPVSRGRKAARQSPGADRWSGMGGGTQDVAACAQRARTAARMQLSRSSAGHDQPRGRSYSHDGWSSFPMISGQSRHLAADSISA